MEELNNIDIFDPVDPNEEPTDEGVTEPAEPSVAEPVQSADDGDVMKEFLRNYGIEDSSKIKFEDEEGLVKERDWDTLSYQEKMNILTSSQLSPERDLAEDEITFINHLRQYNLTPAQYIQAVQQQAVQQYQDNSNQSADITIDSLADDEIFILDLKDRVPNISDEEAYQLLENAKANGDLYQKQIQGLRETLKRQEEDYNKQIEAEWQQQQAEQFNAFSNQIINGIQNFRSIGGLDINMTNDDMEELASFILDKDETGLTYLGQMMNNPDNLVQMAWFALKGREAFDNISAYIADTVAKVRQSSYEKGLADGKNGKVYYKPKTSNEKKIASIDDIYG